MPEETHCDECGGEITLIEIDEYVREFTFDEVDEFIHYLGELPRREDLPDDVKVWDTLAETKDGILLTYNGNQVSVLHALIWTVGYGHGITRWKQAVQFAEVVKGLDSNGKDTSD